MAKLEDRMYRGYPIDKVLKYASRPEWNLDKAQAIYELACRGLGDPSLLPAAWRCIGAAIKYENRLGTPLGQPAALLLIDSKRSDVETSMIESMQHWTSRQQADFFWGLFRKRERLAEIERLLAVYGFQPKFRVDGTGSVLEDTAFDSGE